MNGWDPLLEDLAARRAAAEAMGGPERLARQHEGGRLDARARLAVVLDPGSFREIGAQVGSLGRGMTPHAPADGFVAGHGTIGGRPVLVGAEDFTVMGGSIGPGTRAKRLRLADLARQERVPLVLLLEGTGDRAQHAFDAQAGAPSELRTLAQLRAIVPTVAVVMGTSAGHSALVAASVDFTVMVEGSALFVAGPPLVAAQTGHDVSRVELGGTAVHVVESGVVHNATEDDAAALAMVRQYLDYFPTNCDRRAPTRATGDGPRRLDEILDVVPPDPRESYDVRRVIELVADDGVMFEVQPARCAAMVTALIHLGGDPVAVIANNPEAGGGIDAVGADQAARFLQVVGTFGLPVLFLADGTGVEIGPTAERSGVLRAAARLFAAQVALAGPKLHVTVRQAHGLAAALMAANPDDGQTTTLAFPGARLGPLPAESGVEATTKEPDVAALVAHTELGGAAAAADALRYDDVIDPRELRNELLQALALTRTRDTR